MPRSPDRGGALLGSNVEETGPRDQNKNKYSKTPSFEISHYTGFPSVRASDHSPAK